MTDIVARLRQSYHLDTVQPDHPIRRAVDEIERLRAECERAKQDAARYRWLRDAADMEEIPAPAVFWADEWGAPDAYRMLSGMDLDYEIDALLAKERR